MTEPKWVREQDDYPPMDQVIEPPKPDLSTPEKVIGYSMPEDDPETKAALNVREDFDLRGRLVGRTVLRLVPQRRKRLYSWTNKDGQKWGRWEWETCRPREELAE